MPRFKIQVDQNDPVIAGPAASEALNITVHDGFSHEDVELPKLVAMTFEKNGEDGSVMKHWLDQSLKSGTKISIEVLDDGEIDSPARIESEEKPIAMCWYCFKDADQVGYLVSAPKGTIHICDSCVSICAEEIRNRREMDEASSD